MSESLTLVPLILSSLKTCHNLPQCLLKSFLHHWRILGIDVMIVMLQLVQHLHGQHQPFPPRPPAQQGESEYVVELRKFDHFTILDSRARFPTDMMVLENTYRDSFHLGANEGLKELQGHWCRKESFHKSKTR